MKTVPLHGKKAAGRVALVDDEDYELVAQYRWYVWELKPKPGRRPLGPYAVTYVQENSKFRTLRMHKLLTGYPLTDHKNHDTLDNQRSNLRPATSSQNHYNYRPRLNTTSRYKGVSWEKRRRRWCARITAEGRYRLLGYYASEIEAALAYDVAAAELHGEYAHPNFPGGPTQAMLDQVQAEREAARAEAAAAQRLGCKTSWTKREPETRICTVCGDEYQTKYSGPSLYCGSNCSQRGRYWRRKHQREQKEAGRLL